MILTSLNVALNKLQRIGKNNLESNGHLWRTTLDQAVKSEAIQIDFESQSISMIILCSLELIQQCWWCCWWQITTCHFKWPFKNRWNSTTKTSISSRSIHFGNYSWRSISSNGFYVHIFVRFWLKINDLRIIPTFIF